MMVSADAHSPVLGVSFATDEGVLTTFKIDDDDFETRFPFSVVFFPGGEKDTTTSSPGCVVVVVVVVARVGIPIPMSVRHAACSSRGTKKQARGGVCVRACVRLRYV